MIIKGASIANFAKSPDSAARAILLDECRAIEANERRSAAIELDLERRRHDELGRVLAAAEARAARLELTARTTIAALQVQLHDLQRHAAVLHDVGRGLGSELMLAESVLAKARHALGTPRSEGHA